MKSTVLRVAASTLWQIFSLSLEFEDWEDKPRRCGDGVRVRKLAIHQSGGVAQADQTASRLDICAAAGLLLGAANEYTFDVGMFLRVVQRDER